MLRFEKVDSVNI